MDSAQGLVVGQIAVGVVEVQVAGEAEERRGLGGLLDPEGGERVEVGVGVLGALVAARRDEHPDLGARRGPRGERSPGRDLRVVGMRVDRERAGGELVGRSHGTECSGQARAAIRRSESTARARPASSTSWWVTKRTVSGSMVPGAHAVGRERVEQIGRQRVDARAHDVRLDGSRIDAPGEELGERVGELARTRVVVGQPLDHGLQRDDTRGRDHARLAHAAPEPRSLDARFGDERTRSAEQRADRRAQPLRQAEHRGVGPRRQLGRRHAERDRRVPDAGAVAVHREPVPARDGGDRVELRHPPRATARGHVRVLHEQRGDVGKVVLRSGRRTRDVVGVQRAVFVGQRAQLHPRVARPPPHARSGTRGPVRRTTPRCRPGRAAAARAGSPWCPTARRARLPSRAVRPPAIRGGGRSDPRRRRRRRPPRRPWRGASRAWGSSPCRNGGRRRCRARSRQRILRMSPSCATLTASVPSAQNS